MSKLPSLTGREIIAALNQAGFEVARIRGSHHFLIHNDGGRTVHCLKYGTQLGWLIDPDERLILVFISGREPVEYTGQNSLPVTEFINLNLTVNQVFGWLKVA